jgi:hypothetical protein
MGTSWPGSAGGRGGGARLQRLGYRIVAAVADLPSGHTHYTLVKDLRKA